MEDKKIAKMKSVSIKCKYCVKHYLEYSRKVKTEICGNCLSQFKKIAKQTKE